MNNSRFSLPILVGFIGITQMAQANSLRPNPSFNFTSVAAKHIKVIADPKFEGRMTLRVGNTKAAAYIESVFRKNGLKLQEGKTSYQQPFEVTVGQEGTERNVASGVNSNGKSFNLKLETDYVPASGSTEMKMVSGPVIWLESEMPSGDLTGKIVAIARRLDPKNPNALLNTRITKAVELGAIGIIIVGPSADGRRELPLINTRSGIPRSLETVAIAMTRKSFESMTGINPVTTPASKTDSKTTIRLITETRVRKGDSTNVVGVIPGNDPVLKNEFIVIGGHYDHLGYGETGSRSGTAEIHNGADDNASGTAGVLTLSEYFSKTKSNRRTLIFQAYSGEELGLLGAVAWVQQNKELMPKIQTMINMDMIGRLRNKNLIIYCVNSANEFKTILDSVTINGVIPKYIMSSPGNSDHAPFINNKVPSLFFHTDLNPEYHTEKDTLDTINYEGMGLTIDYVRQSIEKIDQADKFGFAATVQPAGGGDPNRARRVRTGFMPNMGDGDGKPGMLLNGVTPGSPAEAAGVKVGDRLLEFDGKKINNVEELQKILTDAKPNVAVKIKVQRGNDVIELTITPLLPA